MKTPLPQAPPQVVIGTAGHVDHGKSSLLHALTGSTLDRLPAEQQRGLTIELGYAFLPGADHQQALDLGFIDCPGHVRFIRQAIAGLGTMHGAILLIAADEGPQAQTLEHLAVLRLVDLRWGLLVISKADRVDQQQLQAVIQQSQALTAGTVFARQAPFIVSAHSGQGIAALRQELFTQAASDHRHLLAAAQEPVRLAVDRSFSVAGHGTVVTGTLWSGQLRLGDRLQAYPGPLITVRGLQVRGLAVEQAVAGQRVAINLAKVAVSDVPRGCWLAEPEGLVATSALDVQVLPLAEGPGLRHAQQLLVHHGTRQIPARLALYGAQEAQEGLHNGQLRLREPAYLSPGEQLILRRASPSAVIAGAQVLAIDAPRHRRFHEQTEAYFRGLQGHAGQRLVSWLEQRYPQPGSPELAARALGSARRATEARQRAGKQVVVRVLPRGEQWWSRQAWERLGHRILEQLQQLSSDGIAIWHSLDQLHQHCAAECPEAAWEDRLQDLISSGSLLRRGRQVCAHRQLPDPAAPVVAAAGRLLSALQEAGLQPPYDHPLIAADPQPSQASKGHALLEARGWIIRLDQRRCVHRQVLCAALQQLRHTLRTPEHPGIDVQWFKSAWGLTRRDAIPLAEWCDHQGITKRVGNRRILAKDSTPNDELVMHPLLPLPQNAEA